MNYAVLHFEKAPAGTTDGGLDVHIERTESDGRTHVPKNAAPDFDGVRHRELIAGSSSRQAAIAKRLTEFDQMPGTRKRSANQIQVVRVILSGSHDQMERLKSEGRLPQWERSSVKWLQEQFGEDNIVSAVAHYDEKTPHIHATLIPITTKAERRASDRKRAKPIVPRLNVHDILTPQSLGRLQTDYAAAMKEFGFQRGIVGSEARHTSTREYYSDEVRRLKNEIDSKQLDVDRLIDELVKRESENAKLRDENKSLTEQREKKRKALDQERGSMVKRGLAHIFGKSVDDIAKEKDSIIEQLKADKKDLQSQLNEVKRQLKENADLSEQQRQDLIDQAKKLREEKLSLNAEIKRLQGVIATEPQRIAAAKSEGRELERQQSAATIKAAHDERDLYKKRFAESQNEVKSIQKSVAEWRMSHYRVKWIESLINLCREIGLNNVAAIADLIYKGAYKMMGYIDWLDIHLTHETTIVAHREDVTELRTRKTPTTLSYERVKVGEKAFLTVNDPVYGKGVDIESWINAKTQHRQEEWQGQSFHR